jgi:hypothetical protein
LAVHDKKFIGIVYKDLREFPGAAIAFPDFVVANGGLLRQVRGFLALCPAGRARRLSRCDVGACRFGTTDLAWYDHSPLAIDGRTRI